MMKWSGSSPADRPAGASWRSGYGPGRIAELPATQIELRGVHVHNLQNVSLDIPHEKLIVVCGVSGSGKTSLALDTLYTEGQRRYIESFSAYTRQFLERLQKPAAESIRGIPPAIAVTHKNTSSSNRATVGTATEIIDYLRLLFAKIGVLTCHGCGRVVERDTPQTAMSKLARLDHGTRFMVAFPLDLPADTTLASESQSLLEDGFVRWIVGERILPIESPAAETATGPSPQRAFVVVDRLTAGSSPAARICESLEIAISRGQGRCVVFIPESAANLDSLLGPKQNHRTCPIRELDGQPWLQLGFSQELACEDCQLAYPRLEPRLFSFNSPLGACPQCEGFGNTLDIDMELVVPNVNKSLSEGAIAPWNTPSYAHELDELLALADDYGIPIHQPYRDLSEEHRRLIRQGVPEKEFGGLDGFFRWLERRKYKMPIRVFLSRWRSHRTCPGCHGARLRPEALSGQDFRPQHRRPQPQGSSPRGRVDGSIETA